MKLLELPQDKQEGLLKALLRFAYPLYCATEVEGFDYHFIGSCFPIRAGERIFFVFTNHQFKLAIGKTILIAYPENTEKLIGVESKYVAQFESLDLAIFEFSEKGVSEKLHTLDISLITKLDLEKDFEYAVLGCYRAVNVINHETKKIVVKKGALITELAKLDGGKAEFDFSGIYMVSGAKESYQI